MAKGIYNKKELPSDLTEPLGINLPQIYGSTGAQQIVCV